MNSQRNFNNKKRVLIFLILLALCFLLISRLEVNLVEFEGDLAYINVDDSRIAGLIFLKNKNILFSNKEEFIQNLKQVNEEIKTIELAPKNLTTLRVKITNKELCCVVIDSNTNKFLISHDGKVMKKLERGQNYPHEITLNQEININEFLSIESLKKIVEIENVLLSKELEVSEINIDNDRIEFKLELDQILVIDSETNTKNFIEKLTSMLDYFKQKNLSFKKMDFRFGNVVVE